MNRRDRFDIDLHARELRREELARLLGGLGCSLRKALARAGWGGEPACPPGSSLAA